MLKSILRDGTLYSLTDIFSKGLSFLLLPLYTRALTPEDYGTIDMMTISGTLMIYIVGLEVSQAVVRFVPSMQTLTEKRAYISTAFWYFFTALALTFLVCSIFQVPLAGFTLDSPDRAFVFQMGVLSFISNALYFFLQSILRLERRIKMSIILNLIFITTTTLLAVYLIVGLNWGVLGNFVATTAGSTVGIIVFFASTRYIVFGFQSESFKKIVQFSIPLVPASIATYFTFYVDRLFIKSFLSIEQLGLYGIALRFASLTSILVGGFVTAISPIIFQKFAEKETPEELRKAFNFFLSASVLFVMGVACFSKELLIVFTIPVYYDSFQYVAILAFNIIVYNFYVFMPGLSIAKKTKYVASIVILSGLLNIILNYILIERFQTWGSILSTTVASIVSQAITFYFSNKYYPVPFNVRRIILLVFIGLSFSILIPLFDKWKGYEPDWTWIAIKAIVVSGIAVVFIRLLRKNMKQLFS